MTKNLYEFKLTFLRSKRPNLTIYAVFYLSNIYYVLLKSIYLSLRRLLKRRKVMLPTRKKILKLLTNIMTKLLNWIPTTLSITQTNLLSSMNKRCMMSVSKSVIKLSKWDEKIEQILLLLQSRCL